MTIQHIQALTALANRRGLGAGAMSSSVPATAQQQTRPWPTANPPPQLVYTGSHPQANATLTQSVWSGKYWIATGSRVRATFVSGQMYNVECFIGTGQKIQTLVGPIHVPASSLQFDTRHLKPKREVPPLTIPHCPQGQVVYAKYKNGATKQLDADYVNILQSNPALRADIAYLYCALPPGGGYQVGHMGVHGLPQGLGAGGASAFTMTAANALNQYLVTNNCAGCSDMTSLLRQLTFAFKAAVMTDNGLPAQNMNMSTTLAMTAYGPATDAALKLVLGAGTAYANGPCTDDAGNCLGNLATPITPPAIQTLEQQFATQIQSAMKQMAFLPQADIMHTLIQGFGALINQFGFELAKLQNPIPVEATPPVVVTPVVYTPPAPPVVPPTSTPPATTAGAWTTGEKVVAGVVVGAVVVGTGFLLYHAGKKG